METKTLIQFFILFCSVGFVDCFKDIAMSCFQNSSNLVTRIFLEQYACPTMLLETCDDAGRHLVSTGESVRL
jgi:hypothetical protein